MKKTRNILMLGFVSVLCLMPLRGMAYGLPGDINNDGSVNVSDVTMLISKVLAGGDTQWTHDMNGDGRVNIADVTMLISCVLKETTPPVPQGPAMPDNAVIYTVNGYQIVMVPVEGGTFMMGSETNGDYASPVHQVTLSDYSIGMTEVTSGMWKAVMGSYPECYGPTADTENMPMWMCSWDQAHEFIAALNELTGLTFHLPTEAQWEFAARGGNLSQGYLYAGSDDCNEVGWSWDNDDTDRQHEVGMLKPNELGLYDMSGNVKEFCEDDYWTYSGEPQVDPLFISTTPINRKVVRGGSYTGPTRDCTVTSRRNSLTDTFHGSEIVGAGFRLAL